MTHTLREETALRQADPQFRPVITGWPEPCTPECYIAGRVPRYAPGRPCPCSLAPGEYGPGGCMWCHGTGVITEDDTDGELWPWWETDGQGVTRAERHWGGMRSPGDPRQCSILDGDAEAQRRALRDANGWRIINPPGQITVYNPPGPPLGIAE